MRIRRVEVRDFRKLGHAVVEDLADGLNVLVGDNEAGKSTLLAALRAGLFERHRVGGEVAQAMLPYNQVVRPEVSVDFELDGHPWQLRKAFCQRPEAELRGPGERIVGEAVEERLAELFGFKPPGKGRSKPEEHQGVYGLLWVEQGASHRALGVGAGRGAIATALEQEVGQVVGGERGRALLAAAAERHATFWDKRGNPRGGYRALAEEVETLAALDGELRARLLAYDGRVAELDGRNEALARHERDKRLDIATRALAAAREALAGSERLRTAVTAADDTFARRQLEHRAARDRGEARAKLVAEADRAGRADAAATTALAEDEAVAARADAARRRAEVARRTAGERVAGALLDVRALERARSSGEAAEALATLDARLAEACAADERRRERLAAASAIAMDARDLAALEASQAEVDKARLQLEAASVRIGFEPEAGRTVTIEGVAHDVATPLKLSRDAVLTLEGFGRLTIRPGGGVEALAAKRDAAERALAERLGALGMPTVADARAAVAAKLAAQGEAAVAAGTVKAIAQRGLDALRQAVSDRRAAVASSQVGEDATSGDWSQARVDEASLAHDAAAADERGAEDTLAAARRAKEVAELSVATLAERAAGARREHASLSQLLRLARADASDEQLTAQAADAERALEAAEALRAAASRALADADPEAVALELRRADGAERAIRADLEALRRGKRDLEVELRALGRDGLGEQLTEVTERLDAGRRRLAAQDREARAARLLHDTLAKAQSETRDRWLGPVRERAAPYLRLVQPDSDIMLNEGTLEIEGLVRRGVNEPFGGLSVGAREQIAVITRLALAEILNGAKRPSAIILDDALVNTDEERLHRMHLVLQRAGQSMQILILTCREQDFVQLGAPLRRL